MFSISAAIIASIWMGLTTDLTESVTTSKKKHTVISSIQLEASRASSSIITSLNNTYTGGGYHSYGRQTLNLTGYSGTVTVNFYVAGAPNRFTYYDASGNYLNTSNWVGDANYQGPWGSSLHQGPNNFNVYFTGGQTYGVDVETITDPNTSTRINDYWEIYY